PQGAYGGMRHMQPYPGSIPFNLLRILNMTKPSQTLFDSVYNYFPITFKPPPNNPYGVTAQDLKKRLQECISSTDLFAPHAFPLLLDKLDSTSANVKVCPLPFIGVTHSDCGPERCT